MLGSWKVVFSFCLIAVSALLFGLHYAIFRDGHHIFFYLLFDIAFVPINVLLVTLVLERLLETKQKEQRLQKLNMVVDAFFSEVGTPLLRFWRLFEGDNPGLQERLLARSDWTDRDFLRQANDLRRYTLKTDAGRIDLDQLKAFLTERRAFLLSLLENPSLLEHDKFTDMLWALSHLTEELLARRKLNALSAADLEHFSGDIKRAFSSVIFVWLEHMRHLKRDYPYLYSLSVRMNPFNPAAQGEIA